MTNKAYYVYSPKDEGPEYANKLIWAESESQALDTAIAKTDLREFPRSDLRSISSERATKLMASQSRTNEPHVLSAYNRNDCEVMRELGWHMEDYSGWRCTECDRYAFDTLPESMPPDDWDGVDFICQECAKRA